MDNVLVATAGLGLIVVGVLGMTLSILALLVATVRFALLPRLAPTFARLRAEAGSWVAPPARREVALVRSERPRS